MYNSAVGRWMQRDPGPNGRQHTGGMNLYQYVGSRPTVALDPLGLQGVVPVIDGHPIDTWYTVPQYRCNEYGGVVVDGNGRPQELPSGIEKMEQLYWTRVRITPTTFAGSSPARQINYRVVRKCHVLVELAHVWVPDAGELSGRGPFGLAAYGHLTCHADATGHWLNYVEEDVYGDYTPGMGCHGEVVRRRVGRPGLIDDFPRQLGYIGPAVVAGLEHGNADMGTGAGGFHRLMNAAWTAAVAKGNRFADDCMCECDNITVVFFCAGSDAQEWARGFCGRISTIPCKKNSLSGAR